MLLIQETTLIKACHCIDDDDIRFDLMCDTVRGELSRIADDIPGRSLPEEGGVAWIKSIISASTEADHRQPSVMSSILPPRV